MNTFRSVHLYWCQSVMGHCLEWSELALGGKALAKEFSDLILVLLLLPAPVSSRNLEVRERKPKKGHFCK